MISPNAAITHAIFQTSVCKLSVLELVFLSFWTFSIILKLNTMFLKPYQFQS